MKVLPFSHKQALARQAGPPQRFAPMSPAKENPKNNAPRSWLPLQMRHNKKAWGLPAALPVSRLHQRICLPMLLTPTWIVKDVTLLPLHELHEKGIKLLIFDLDDTLIPNKTGLVPQPIGDWLKTLDDHGFQFIVITNNYRPWYREQAEALLGCPVWGPARKPSARLFRKAMAHYNVTGKQTLIVGDRPLADVYGGKRAGCYTALVDNLTGEHPNAFLRTLLRLERRLVNKVLSR